MGKTWHGFWAITPAGKIVKSYAQQDWAGILFQSKEDAQKFIATQHTIQNQE